MRYRFSDAFSDLPELVVGVVEVVLGGVGGGAERPVRQRGLRLRQQHHARQLRGVQRERGLQAPSALRWAVTHRHRYLTTLGVFRQLHFKPCSPTHIIT